jgi:hypothetical protein
LVLEDIETDSALGVDVGMIDLVRKLDVRRLEGIVRWEGDVQVEDPTRVGAVLWSEKRCRPVEEIAFVHETCRAIAGRVVLEIGKFTEKLACCHWKREL